MHRNRIKRNVLRFSWMNISNVSLRAAAGSLATQQLLLRSQSPKKVDRLGLGVNKRALVAQLLFAVVSRPALLANRYRELIPQGVERPGRETDLSLPLTLILWRSRTGTAWFYTSTSNKRAARPKLYTKSLTRDLKLMYSRFTLVRISINL